MEQFVEGVGRSVMAQVLLSDEDTGENRVHEPLQ